MEYLIDLDLGGNGGSVKLRDVDRFVSWLELEEANWRWLSTMPAGGAIANTPTHVQNHFASLFNIAQRVKSGQAPDHQLRDNVMAHFGVEAPPLLHSKGELGQAIQAIREQLGEEDAALTYAFYTGQANPTLRLPRHVKLLFMGANPNLITSEARNLAARASWRGLNSEAQRLLEEQKDFLEAKEADYTSLIEKAERAAGSFTDRILRNYASARKEGWRDTRAAIESINATKRAYTEDMNLRASVTYWKSKKTMHRKREKIQGKALRNFIIGSSLGGLLTFIVFLLIMLDMSGADLGKADVLTTTDPLPATSYIVVLAALGAILTGIFWAARILVRNYLAERHLAQDAEERRVMTKTYLALINEKAAIADEDRLVILNALFRQSIDGFARDEGPQDIALPAILAKLLDQRSS